METIESWYIYYGFENFEVTLGEKGTKSLWQEEEYQEQEKGRQQ